MSDTSVLVVGGGGHARVVIESLLTAGRRVSGFTERSGGAPPIAGVPCLGTDDVLESLDPLQHEIFVALGDNRLRGRLCERAIALGFRLANAIHPSAWISPTASLGQGVAVMAQSAINANTRLEDGAVVNTGATVDHDCRIGRFVHLAPGAHLAGYVDVAEGALVGVGSAVGRGRPLRIGSWAVLGTGTVAVHDVPGGATVVGNPARLLSSLSPTPTSQEP